ncbi:MAG: hypothetical protein IPM16_20795 [Chloroflexi bacterium]|nr:hypothetical protein [Chloroflexota bacterium]
MNYYKETGDPRLAEALDAVLGTSEAFLEVAERIGDVEIQLAALNNLASAKYDAGYYQDSIADCEDALEIANRDPAWRYWIGVLHHTLGMSFDCMGDNVRAKHALCTAFEIYSELGDSNKIRLLREYAAEREHVLE